MDVLSLWQRLKLAGGVMKRGNEALADVPAGIMPPSRAAACDPLALSTVFRGIQVLQTAIPLADLRDARRSQTGLYQQSRGPAGREPFPS